MKDKIQETTSVGTAIALSISDPGNQDAVFVPFSNPKNKKQKPIKRNYNMSKTLLESLQLGGMNSAIDALRASLNESEKSPEKSAQKIKQLLECKKNKEEFKKLMAEKKAKKEQGKDQKPSEEPKKEEPKKMSLKDKIAQKRAARQQKVNENTEKCPACGEEKCVCESKSTCEYCGKEDCICENVNGKKCCSECADGLKKKQERINEGVKRLKIRMKLDEAKKRHYEAKKKPLNESAADFNKELKLMQAAREHGFDASEKLNEDFTNDAGNCDDVMVGIVLSYWDIDPESAEKIHNYAQEVGMEFKDDQMDKFVFGMSISKNKNKSVDEITAEVDKVSAGLFAILEEIGVSDKISTHTSLVVITE